MEEIPSAEQYLNNKSAEIPSKYKELNAFLHDSDIATIMIEFAKLHVQAALQAVVDVNEPHMYDSTILNAYPIDNIK